MNKIVLAALAFAMSSTLALAGSGWHRVGDFDAGGDPKEAAVNRNCSVCLVKVTDGSVVINTIVVREENDKTPIKIGERIESGNHKQVDLGGKTYVKGLRISDDGKGHYEVYVK